MTGSEIIAMLQRHGELNPGFLDDPLFVKNGGEIEGLGLGGGKQYLHHEFRPVHSDASKWTTFSAMFQLARVEVLGHWEIANDYWPNAYTQLRLENPWWLVKTHAGLIEIGNRKSVLSIDWSDTPIRKIITDDDVTKKETMVHAWTEAKAVEYLSALAPEIKAVIAEKEEVPA